MADADLIDSQISEKPRRKSWQPSHSSAHIPSHQPLPPNPSLHALLLVVRSGTGPRVVFHCPPKPSQDVCHADVTVPGARAEDLQDDGDDSDTLGDLSDGSDEANDFASYKKSVTSHKPTFAGDDEPSHNLGDSLEVKPKYDSKGFDTIFGHAMESIATLMAPRSQEWHQKRLEVSLDGRVFIGSPIFKDEDGNWKSHRTPKPPGLKNRPGKSRRTSAHDHNATRQSSISHLDSDASDADSVDGGSHADSSPLKRMGASPNKLEPTLSRSDSSQHGLLSTSTPSDYSAASSNGPTSLTMFNVVAVISPPTLEYQHRVDDMYRNVVRALATILRRLQHKKSFVEHQAHLLDKIMSDARHRGLTYSETWREVAAKSALARAFATTFDSISQSKVAHLSFKSARSVDSSIQIPHPLSTPFGPSLTTPSLAGLSLSSSDFTMSDQGESVPTTAAVSISPHCALLLEEESRDKLIRKMTASHLTAGRNTSKAMAYFIRHVSPRKTLLQFSRVHHVPVGHVQLLALQLVRWKLARPISPLHATSAFIVSPNADWNALEDARRAYARRFPTLPEMMAILSKLHGTAKSGISVTWATLIPSTDHKDAYMDLLAWLMRGGWLCELRTFAWIKVTSEVKKAVTEVRKKELEELGRTLESDTAIDDSHMMEEGQLSDFGTPERRPSSGDYSHHGPPPHLRHYLYPNNPASEAGSTASNRTTIKLSTHLDNLRMTSMDRKSSADSHSHEDLSDRASHLRRPGTSRRIRHTSLDPEELDFEPSVIHEPTRLNTLQQRWVQHIGDSFQDERLRVAWPRLIKYFDGEHALEEIAVVEGWKRKVATELLAGILSEQDCLQTVKHW